MLDKITTGKIQMFEGPEDKALVMFHMACMFITKKGNSANAVILTYNLNGKISNCRYVGYSEATNEGYELHD